MHNILYTYTKETQLRLNYIQWTSCGFSKCTCTGCAGTKQTGDFVIAGSKLTANLIMILTECDLKLL